MDPNTLVDILLEGKKPEPTWRVAIQQPEKQAGINVPGWIQIDMVDANGVNHGSTSPKKLAELGYDLPDFSSVSTGRYTIDLKPLSH